MDDLMNKLDIGALVTGAVAFVPDVIAALLILALFWVVYRVTRVPLQAILQRAGLHETVVVMLVHNIYRLTVFIFGLVMAADQVGINVGAALAGIGVVGIAYKESIPEARAVILEAIGGIPHVLADPAPDVVVTELGSSSINMDVRVWIKQASREQSVYFRVMEASKLALDAAGIEIPYPHLQLFIEQIEDRVWEKITDLRTETS